MAEATTQTSTTEPIWHESQLGVGGRVVRALRDSLIPLVLGCVFAFATALFFALIGDQVGRWTG